MKVLILSDTHGKKEKAIRDIVERVKPDYIIHCGDACGTERYLDTILPQSTCVIVRGNCDINPLLEDEEIVRIGKYKIMVIHGNRQGLSYGLEKLKDYAKRSGCNVVMFGHTHKAVIDMRDEEIIALNPGSFTYPRSEDNACTYALMDIDAQGEAHYNIAKYEKAY